MYIKGLQDIDLEKMQKVLPGGFLVQSDGKYYLLSYRINFDKVSKFPAVHNKAIRIDYEYVILSRINREALFSDNREHRHWQYYRD